MTYAETRGIVYAIMVDHKWPDNGCPQLAAIRRDVEKALLRRCDIDLDFCWSMAAYGTAIFAELIEAKKATRH